MGDSQTALAPRVIAFDRLIEAAKSREAAEAAWASFPERMRFRLGTSHVDRRVPFAVGSDVVTVVRCVLWDLVALFRHRYEGGLKTTLSNGSADLRERAFALRVFRDGSLERRIAISLVATDPSLDAALLEPLLLRNGSGMALLQTLSAVYRKSLDEEARLQGTEPTAWLTHVALLGHLRVAKEALKAETIKGFGYEPLERACGFVLSALVAFAVEDALEDRRRRVLPPQMARTEALLMAAGSPLSLVTIQSAVLRLAPNPWGLSKELSDAIDTLGVHPFSDGAQAVVGQVVRRIGKNRDVRALAYDLGAMGELRAAVFRYLREFDLGKDPRNAALADSVMGSHLLSQAMMQVKAYEAAWHGAASLRESSSGTHRARLDELVGLYEHLAKKRAPLDPDAALANVAAGWLAWRRDRHAEERLEAARAVTVDRAREFAVPELKSQYEAGRVYRLAPDAQPILFESAGRHEEGHLFLDLKGFTRMVALAKEASAVEFMRREFYVPILARAKDYRETGRRLELNNLLGDAVSFSGDIVALVHLAEDINQIFIDYEDRLRSRGLKATRIEAGLFIAFGAPAETIHVESEGWGEAGFSETVESGRTRQQRIKVAIAEKINESARGTARSGVVFTRLSARLEEDAWQRGGEKRELPWGVFVDKVMQLTLPPAITELCERAQATGSADFAAAAGRAVGEVLEKALIAQDGTLAKLFGSVNDLYNVGRALSKEAVDAFVRDTASMRVTVEKSLPVAELPASFGRFLFPETTIQLVVSYDTGKARPKPIVFRFAGELQFKGFEGLRSTAIYEILDSSSPIYTLLDRHFFEGWRPGG